MILTIDTEKIGELVQNGKDILFTPGAEKALIELMELEATVAAALDDARHQIEEKGLAINQNFTGVVGDNVKVGYRYFGSKYRITPGYEQELLEHYPNMVERTVKVSLIGKAVEAFQKESGSIPMGIDSIDRKKQITIKRTTEADDE